MEKELGPGLVRQMEREALFEGRKRPVWFGEDIIRRLPFLLSCGKEVEKRKRHLLETNGVTRLWEQKGGSSKLLGSKQVRKTDKSRDIDGYGVPGIRKKGIFEPNMWSPRGVEVEMGVLETRGDR
ncbi:MAG: hypothetical protein NZ602_14205 [Thermoguttaceae bacterium]|nr:hypothetical protein [Thermoguttaceae bacterium]MDW8036982.1 hypothetical protein [Thermoguttaceae bacterium]